MNKQLSIIEDLDYNKVYRYKQQIYIQKVNESDGCKVVDDSVNEVDNVGLLVMIKKYNGFHTGYVSLQCCGEEYLEDCSSFNDELEMNLYDCIKIVDAKKITLADLPESMSLKNARLLIEENEENCTFARKNKIFLCRLIRRAVTNVIRDRLKKDNLSLIDEKLEEFWLFLTT